MHIRQNQQTTEKNRKICNTIIGFFLIQGTKVQYLYNFFFIFLFYREHGFFFMVWENTIRFISKNKKNGRMNLPQKRDGKNISPLFISFFRGEPVLTAEQWRGVSIYSGQILGRGTGFVRNSPGKLLTAYRVNYVLSRPAYPYLAGLAANCVSAENHAIQFLL